MATTEVIEDLTAVAQACIESKLQAGFDAQAEFTIDIAREIAQALEDQLNSYTDVRISEVLDMIDGNEVDLEPFLLFMTSINNLLDGDELTGGFQIFELLSTDAAFVKTGVAAQTVTLAGIQSQLSTFQATIDDHNSRITALEAALHDAFDCEDCHDELLTLVGGSVSAACTEVTTIMDSYSDAESSSVLSAWRSELNPITMTLEGVYSDNLNIDGFPDGEGLELTLSGTYTGKIQSAVAVFESGVSLPLTVDMTEGTFTRTFSMNEAAYFEKAFVVNLLDAAGNVLSSMTHTGEAALSGPVIDHPSFVPGHDGLIAVVLQIPTDYDPRIADIRLHLEGQTVPANVTKDYAGFIQDIGPAYYENGAIVPGQVQHKTTLPTGNGTRAQYYDMYYFDADGVMFEKKGSIAYTFIDDPMGMGGPDGGMI